MTRIVIRVVSSRAIWVLRTLSRSSASPTIGTASGREPMRDNRVNDPSSPSATRVKPREEYNHATATDGPDGLEGLGDLPGDDDVRRPVRRGDVLPDHGRG